MYIYIYIYIYIWALGVARSPLAEAMGKLTERQSFKDWLVANNVRRRRNRNPRHQPQAFSTLAFPIWFS